MTVKKKKIFLITTFIIIIAAVVIVLCVGYFTKSPISEYDGTLVEASMMRWGML